MLNFNSLREIVKAMAQLSLANKPTEKNPSPHYVADTVTYLNDDGTVARIDKDKTSVLSGSNGEYYPLDKDLKKGTSEQKAEFNTKKIAVALRNLENRYGKHAYQIFSQGNKLVDLLNGSAPVDPTWVQGFMDDLAKLAQAVESAGNRNIAKFENWTAEETKADTNTNTEKRAWSPV